MAIIFGMPLLLLFMVLVMGFPLAYFVKQDHAYEATKGQPDEVRVKAWYKR